MTSPALAHAQAKLANLKHRLSAAHERSASMVEDAMGVATGVVAGIGFGAAEEYWGEGALMGADIPMVVGVPATLFALAGYGGAARSAVLEVGKAGLIIEGYKGGGSLARDWLEEDSERPAAER